MLRSYALAHWASISSNSAAQYVIKQNWDGREWEVFRYKEVAFVLIRRVQCFYVINKHCRGQQRSRANKRDNINSRNHCICSNRVVWRIIFTEPDCSGFNREIPIKNSNLPPRWLSRYRRASFVSKLDKMYGSMRAATSLRIKVVNAGGDAKVIASK